MPLCEATLVRFAICTHTQPCPSTFAPISHSPLPGCILTSSYRLPLAKRDDSFKAPSNPTTHNIARTRHTAASFASLASKTNEALTYHQSSNVADAHCQNPSPSLALQYLTPMASTSFKSRNSPYALARDSLQIMSFPNTNDRIARRVSPDILCRGPNTGGGAKAKHLISVWGSRPSSLLRRKSIMVSKMETPFGRAWGVPGRKGGRRGRHEHDTWSNVKRQTRHGHVFTAARGLLSKPEGGRDRESACATDHLCWRSYHMRHRLTSLTQGLLFRRI